MPRPDAAVLDPVGEMPSGPILMPETLILAADMPTGIRLNHMNNDRHDIRHPHEDRWFSFNGHTLIVDTEEEARFIEDTVGRDVIKRDDLPHPVECELCRSQGNHFSTKCLPLYSRHVYLQHQ